MFQNELRTLDKANYLGAYCPLVYKVFNPPPKNHFLLGPKLLELEESHKELILKIAKNPEVDAVPFAILFCEHFLGRFHYGPKKPSNEQPHLHQLLSTLSNFPYAYMPTLNPPPSTANLNTEDGMKEWEKTVDQFYEEKDLINALVSPINLSVE